jgi:hypothetical protein
MESDGRPAKAVRLPTMELDGYRLASGVVSNEKWPKSFPIPPERLRRRLRKGYSAKLVFQIRLPKQRHPFGERMWVNIDGRDGPYYVGTLHNQPLCYGTQKNLKRGQKVVFLPEHIVDVLRLPERPTSECYDLGSWLVQYEVKRYLAKRPRPDRDRAKDAYRKRRARTKRRLHRAYRH